MAVVKRWIGVEGVYQEGTVEVDDNATEKEIDAAVFEEAGQLIDWGWSKED